MTKLAETAGLSRQMIGFIEKGTCVPTAASLYRIAKSFDIPLGEILAAVDAEFAGKTKLPKRKTT